MSEITPRPLITRFEEIFGEEIKALLSSLTKPLTQCIRVNELQTSSEIVKKQLSKHRVQLEELQDVPYGFRVHGRRSVGGLHEYLFGYYYIQAMASMLPPIALDPQPDEVVLDMAAAPGGKTTHIAQIMRNEGTLVAVDNSQRKLRILESHLWRLGITNTVVLKGDSRDFERSTMQFDRILLDAPCTGDGGPEDPQDNRVTTIEDVQYCSQIQSQLLDAAFQVLKPGGILVYSTCSLHPEENEFVIDRLLRRQSNFKLMGIDFQTGDPGFTSAFSNDFLPELKKTRRWFPHKHNTIGFFIAKLQKME
ncbi:MAG: RsmB/NOP family class I SAM-dependent RNA methyltransferase [Candidatus Ranarchaeia archaeon]